MSDLCHGAHLMDLRRASGAEPGWVDGLIEAVRPRAFSRDCRAGGASRERWENCLFEARWIFLKLQADSPSRPSAADWDELKEAAAKLLAALPPFFPKRKADILAARRPLFSLGEREGMRLPAGWWGGSGLPLGAHHEAVADLHDLAGRGGGHAKRGGRPPVDHRAFVATALLLGPYQEGFASLPSPRPGGPTVRFVEAFFRSLEGEWCSCLGAKPVGDLPPATATRFVATCPEPRSLPTLVKKAIRAGGYVPTIDERVTLFPANFFRPAKAIADARSQD